MRSSCTGGGLRENCKLTSPASLRRQATVSQIEHDDDDNEEDDEDDHDNDRDDTADLTVREYSMFREQG